MKPVFFAKYFLALVLSVQVGQAKAMDKTSKDTANIAAIYLYQTSALNGDLDVYIAQDRVKVLDKRTGSGISAKAPDWAVNVFEGRNKRICTIPIAKYTGGKQKVATITGGTHLDRLPLRYVGKGQVNGIACSEYQTTDKFAAQQEKDRAAESADPRFVHQAQLMVAGEQMVQAKVASLLALYYGIPELDKTRSIKNYTGHAIPLKFCYRDLRGDVHDILITSAKKTIKLSSLDFEPPQGYRKVTLLKDLEYGLKPKEPAPRKVIESTKPNKLRKP